LKVRSQNENEYNETDEWNDNGEPEDRTDGLDDEQQLVDSVVTVVKEESVSVVVKSPIRIATWEWCKGITCQTRGILNLGHRRPLVQRGGINKGIHPSRFS
jgi:hypothetical protein